MNKKENTMFNLEAFIVALQLIVTSSHMLKSTAQFLIKIIALFSIRNVTFFHHFSSRFTI